MTDDREIVLEVPGSKSITQRTLVAAALADGASILSSPLHSEDTMLLRDALRQFGIEIEDSDMPWKVHGTGGRLICPSDEIFMGNNGTGIRFLMSFASLCPGVTVLTGTKRMEERPALPLLEALTQLGVEAESIKGTGCPPVRIVSKGLKGGKVRLSASISSQFLSSLLMVSPYADSPVTIELDGRLVSRPYVNITLRVMKDFGVEVKESNDCFTVPVARYGARNYVVEADASSASYFFGAAAVTSASVRVSNLPEDPIQGDAYFCHILEQMGCKLEKGPNGTTVTGPEQGGLRGIDIDMSMWPDVVPTLAVVAAFARGKTVIRNVGHLRVKETDRIKAVVTELRRIGCIAEELPDGLIVEGSKERLRPACITTYDDHRIAMCFAIARLLVPGISFDDKAVVRKSFPDFWQRWQILEERLGRSG